jgi:hypothetical protein
MSIAMERFGSNEKASESRIAVGIGNPAFPYRLQCPTCGFESTDPINPPPRCPKCAGHSWERIVFPGSLLTHANRRADKRRDCNRRSRERMQSELMP